MKISILAKCSLSAREERFVFAIEAARCIGYDGRVQPLLEDHLSDESTQTASIEPTHEQQAAYEAAKAQALARRRSFIFKILIFWFSLMFGIIMLMIFVRSTALNDSDKIVAKIQERVNFQPPARFEPYRGNVFLGVHSVAYWANDDRREDGRSTSVIGFYWEEDWAERSASDLATEMVEKLPKRLNRNEFHADRMIEESVGIQGDTVTLYRFDGTHRLDDKLVPGTACFRYMDTPKGPIQIQTMGLETSFSAADQIQVLAEIRSR